MPFDLPLKSRSHAKLRIHCKQMGAHSIGQTNRNDIIGLGHAWGKSEPGYFNGRHEMCSFQYNLGQFENRTFGRANFYVVEKRENVDHYVETIVASHSSKQVHSTDFRQTPNKTNVLSFVPFLINSSNNHLLS